MSDLRERDVFADHRIEAVLGRGGMGVVYRARQLTLDRPAALKLVAPGHADDERFRARFLREARAAAAIDHPNVLPIYSAGEEDGQLYVSMRLVDGGDLAARIRAQGRLAPDEAVAVVGQVAAGLDAAHAAGLVHRDVKAANVLVGPSGTAYLTDFGVARLRGARTELTGTGQMLGTLDYMAPEQINGEDVDGRADVYSLGCLLYECLTDTPVFAHREGVPATLRAHLEEAPPSAHEQVPEVPTALDGVIATAMAKSPDDRYQSAGALADAAATAVPGAGATVVSEAPPTRAMGGGGAAGTAATAVADDPGDRPRVFGLTLPVAGAIAGALVAVLVVVVAVLVLSGGNGGSGTTVAEGTTTAASGYAEQVDRELDQLTASALATSDALTDTAQATDLRTANRSAQQQLALVESVQGRLASTQVAAESGAAHEALRAAVDDHRRYLVLLRDATAGDPAEGLAELSGLEEAGRQVTDRYGEFLDLAPDASSALTTADLTNIAGLRTALTAAREGTATATGPATTPTVFTDPAWQSPTGNLDCAIQDGEVDLVCTSSADGLAVSLPEVGPPTTSATQGPAGEGVVVPYGSVWQRGPFTCSSQTEGITCRSTASGRGFFLARGAYQPR